jgi:nitrile hydratase
METIDLTTQPPRSPHQKMEGLYMMPRTIDKLRAKLPGGNIGVYSITTPFAPGLSLMLLDGIGVTEEWLLEIVQKVSVEDEIADWLRRNADLSSVASLNKKLFSPRIEDVLAFIPAATFYEIYPAAEKMSITSPMFEVLLEDDRLMFPNHFKNGSASALANRVAMLMSDSHSHSHTDVPKAPALRIKAIETVLAEKGLIDPMAIEEVIQAYETKIGPRNGAQVVARAWVDPSFKERLLADAPKAVAELGYSGLMGENMVALENTSTVHNVFVCTLCSCYPWPVLGLPPTWYKSAPYRSRIVMEPRAVLAEMGLEVPAETEVRVWDSNAELRYFVLPMRPPGTEGWSEQQLAAIVTRDAMIGTASATISPDEQKGAHA